jgi:lysophospholipase L1-like esterase
MPRTVIRQVLTRIAALLFGTALAVLVLELGLRIAGYDGDRERTARAFDARYGDVPKDSWIFDFAIDPARHHTIDLRGQTILVEKPANETRVLFIGDSATEGAFVELEQSYPRRFEAMLRERDPNTPIRAINAGVWGMTTIDELRLLEDKLLPLAPDAVVLGLFMANDINFNLAHGRRALRYHAPRWVDGLRQRSALAHFAFLRALALNQRHRFMDADTLGASWLDERISLVDQYGFHMLSYPAGEVALYMKAQSKLADEAFSVLRDALLQLRELGARRGFAVRVLLIPTPSSVRGSLAILHHPDILYQLRQQGIAIAQDDLDFALPTRRVLAICKELVLDCVDATPDFERIGMRAFFTDDEHPTIAGHEALAGALMPR